MDGSQSAENRITDLNSRSLRNCMPWKCCRRATRTDSRLKDLKKKYYSIAIYDIIRQDIFGYSPVYLVGPRLRYVLDEGRALIFLMFTHDFIEAGPPFSTDRTQSQ